MIELLTPKQMNEADHLTIEGGVPGIQLIQSAGDVLLMAVHSHFANAHDVLIVSGIGNNGGDGFVLAERLANSGRNVSVTILGDASDISGDAKLAYDAMPDTIKYDDHPNYDNYDLIVDAIFGAGLCREIKGIYAEAVSQINTSPTKVLSVDLPSGINGATGHILGCAVQADVTATFFRKKPGHILCPGRFYCGEIALGQIGIQNAVLDEIAPACYLNAPHLWLDNYPFPDPLGHKYDKGHALAISAGLEKSGAARLMAKASLRIGAGLVTIACPQDTLSAHAARTDAIMLSPMDGLNDLLSDARINSICLGPGLDPDVHTRQLVEDVLKLDKSIVLDAGALTAFSNKPDDLFSAIGSRAAPTILTPHDGEFARLFPEIDKSIGKIDQAKVAANLAGATIILKGPDTVIAEPNGRIAVSNNAPAWLATAGSGDVLCGMISGLLAQGMPEFEAACAAVWFHGEAGNISGPGLISSELELALKIAIQNFYKTFALSGKQPTDKIG